MSLGKTPIQRLVCYCPYLWYHVIFSCSSHSSLKEIQLSAPSLEEAMNRSKPAVCWFNAPHVPNEQRRHAHIWPYVMAQRLQHQKCIEPTLSKSVKILGDHSHNSEEGVIWVELSVWTSFSALSKLLAAWIIWILNSILLLKSITNVEKSTA